MQSLINRSNTFPVRNIFEQISQLAGAIHNEVPGLGTVDGTIASDIVRTASGWKLTCELPGVEKSKISLQGTPDTLTIKAQSPATEVAEGERLILRGRIGTGELVGKFKFPVKIDHENATASFENGMLVVKVSDLAIFEARPIQIS